MGDHHWIQKTLQTAVPYPASRKRLPRTDEKNGHANDGPPINIVQIKNFRKLSLRTRHDSAQKWSFYILSSLTHSLPFFVLLWPEKPELSTLYHLGSQLGLANGGTGRRSEGGERERSGYLFAPDNQPGYSSRSSYVHLCGLQLLVLQALS